ncbi:hypothetical protein AWR41_00140 [Riemerella anatipestifer]|uniref:hypothetical protein n=1 Tax=Riemerella anatipestifer TaxID=34085 RepID=UPI0007EC7623|nr:hypothetical protein [Riemerella anatipestifer]OBP42564.1 hypothetical protein AWR41_00140 [Riemerella anatipestifer]
MTTKTTKLSVFAFLGLGLVVYGQDYSGKVGINYDKPSATLEIKGKSANTATTLEGLIIPNVSKNKAYLMTTNADMSLKESTLIYVNDISDYTGSDAKVADITEKGYYYWNGTKWVKNGGGASVGAINGLTLASGNVKLGGTLTEATTIDQNNNALTFTTGTTGKLNVNGNLYLQNRVYVVPNKNANNTGNGLANTSVAGANLRNYDGTGVPDYNDNDYMIVLTNIGVDTKLALPSAKENPGRIIYLINGTTQGLGFSGTGTGVEDTLPFNFGTLATRSGVAFVSTGKTWYPIGR